MNLREYMEATDATAIYGINTVVYAHAAQERIEDYANIAYVALKLNGEAGEVAEEVGKAMRDDAGVFTPDRLEKLEKELGDVLWYWARLCRELGMNPHTVMDRNLAKLQSRKERGVIGGSGSER